MILACITNTFDGTILVMHKPDFPGVNNWKNVVPEICYSLRPRELTEELSCIANNLSWFHRSHPRIEQQLVDFWTPWRSPVGWIFTPDGN